MKLVKRNTVLGKIVSMAFLLFPTMLFSEPIWVPLDSITTPTAPEVELISSTDQKVEISIVVHSMVVEDTIVNGTTYQKISLPEYEHSTTPEIGKPELPAIRKLVAIPPQSGVGLDIISGNDTILSGYTVYPHQPPKTDSGPIPPFTIDTAFYATNVFYPENLGEIGTPGIMRDLRVINVTTYPMVFNPVTGELKVYRNLTVTLNFIGTDSRNILPEIPTEIEADLAPLYKSLIINYEALGIPTVAPVLPRYLIITADEYYDAIQDFVEWKRRMGYRVEIMSGTFGPGDTANIKNYIKTEHQGEPLKYVLLVGDGYRDGPDIPLFKGWEHPGYPGTWIWSDYYYSLMTDDAYPDLAIGRFCVGSVTEVETIVSKVFKYEKNPAVSWNTKKCLLVAYNSPGYIDCKKWIVNNILGPNSIPYETAYGDDPSATDQWVKDVINSGIGIVDYRGHGFYYCWGNPTWNVNGESFDIEEIRSLNNPDYLPVFFNICCVNGAIQSANEVVVEAQTRYSGGGGVGACGATRPSFTRVNHIFDRELFHGIYNEEIYRVGTAINRANTIILPEEDHLPDCTWIKTGLANARMYLWCGDPSLDIWTDVPSPLYAEYPSYIYGDTPTDITVTVTDDSAQPVEGAYVCLHQSGYSGFPKADYTGSGGTVTFESVEAGWIWGGENTVLVTVTKHNYIPYEGSIDVRRGCPYVLVWDGKEYIEDNNIIPPDTRDTTKSGVDGVDYYQFVRSLVAERTPGGDYYQLRL